MTKLALLRHGQSEWNLQNRFTGWVDIPLTEQGRAEAAKAGTLLKECGAEFVHAYTSVISRAIITLNLAQEEMGETWMPVTKDYRLNERHYGGLTGLNKAETAKIHGDAQVKIWRRSYDTPPPLLEDSSEFPSLADRRYAGIEVPKAESLKLTLERVEPYWENVLAPRLCAGENLIIAAHGNSLRALVKLLLDVSDKDIVGVEIPTGNPLLLDLKPGSTKVKAAAYLDEDRASDIPKIT